MVKMDCRMVLVDVLPRDMWEEGLSRNLLTRSYGEPIE